MSTAAELTRTLATVAEEIATAAKRLLAQLETERSALISGDATTIDLVTAKKQALLQQIETLESERRHLLSYIGEGTYQLPFAMERELAQYKGAAQQWRDTVATLARCQQLNEANGSLVELRMRHVRQALDLVMGVPSRTELYGPQGEPANLRKSHPLAKV